ncbi:MAG: cupin domain-containing protein [Marinilabiliales bacterium]|nr:cupin domain-containing protein [Marinilabiliales bacterium]
MATILRSSQRKFETDAGKQDPFKILTDSSRRTAGISPEYLNFDLRQLQPGQFSAPYHFHKYAEELFLIVSGSAQLRSPEGLADVESGDLIFFPTGDRGAHQLFNPTDAPCLYLDIRSYIGFDLCEYPDSDKILIAPSMEVFRKGTKVPYFDGEDRVQAIWQGLRDPE